MLLITSLFANHYKPNLFNSCISQHTCFGGNLYEKSPYDIKAAFTGLSQTQIYDPSEQNI